MDTKERDEFIERMKDVLQRWTVLCDDGTAEKLFGGARLSEHRHLMRESIELIMTKH